MSQFSAGLKLFSTFYIISAIFIQFSCASLQQLTFFDSFGCLGDKNESFTETQDELDKSWVTNSSSIFIMGLWTITFFKTDANGTIESISYIHYNAKPPNGRCMNKHEWSDIDAENHKVWFAARFGPSDMTTKQAIFFTSDWYGGIPFVADSNEQEQLTPRPVAIWSQLIFSNASWTSYPKNDFIGKATHYLPSGQFGNNTSIIGPPLEDNYSYNNSYLGIVKSAKMGIHPDNIEEEAVSKSSRENGGLTLQFLIFWLCVLTI